MSDNLRIWGKVPKTDPKYTKAANVGGNRQTSIDGVYMVKTITEILGPVGIGWGYSVVEERYENTKPVMIKGESGLEILRDGDSIVWEQNHTIRIEMWAEDRSNTFSQFGHTKFRYMKSDGSKMIIDDEAPKKSLTDAMKKCLSLLGVCSDVFMGEFDDKAYQDAAKLENDLKKADNADQEYANKTEEFNQYISKQADAMGMCPNFTAMQKVYGLAANKIDREAPILGIDAADAKRPIDAKYHEMKAKFDQENNQ